MGRHEQREQVFRLLFQVEFHMPEEMPRQMRLFLEDNEEIGSQKDADYIEARCQCVREKIPEIDKLIDDNTVGWETARMGKVETIQKEMLERARSHREAHTYTAVSMEEFEKIFNEKSGFVKAMWCGNEECEVQIKEKLSVTSRCMPFEQEHISDTCVCCGKPAKKMVYWGRAY